MPLKSTAARLAQRLLPLLAAILSLFMAIHLAFAATPAHANPPAAEVSAARVAGTDSRTRFVADLDRPVSYSVYVISDPYRVVVDMHDVRFNMPASLGEASPMLGSGLVTLGVVLTLGFALNDSGIVIPAIGVALAVPLLVAVSANWMLELRSGVAAPVGADPAAK